jgi:hypothetical protein
MERLRASQKRLMVKRFDQCAAIGLCPKAIKARSVETFEDIVVLAVLWRTAILLDETLGIANLRTPSTKAVLGLRSPSPSTWPNATSFAFCVRLMQRPRAGAQPPDLPRPARDIYP